MKVDRGVRNKEDEGVPREKVKIGESSDGQVSLEEGLYIYVEGFYRAICGAVESFRSADVGTSPSFKKQVIEEGVLFAAGSAAGYASLAVLSSGALPSATATSRRLSSSVWNNLFSSQESPNKLVDLYDSLSPNEAQEVIIKAAIIVFKTFRKPFAKLVPSDYPFPRMILCRLSLCAAQRAAKYISQYDGDDNELSTELLVKGVVLGEIEKNFDTFTNFRFNKFNESLNLRFNKFNESLNLRFNKFNESLNFIFKKKEVLYNDVYYKTAVCISEEEVFSYHKDCAKKYGYRLPFDFEKNGREGLPEGVRSFPIPTDNFDLQEHDYVLQEIDIQQKFVSIVEFMQRKLTSQKSDTDDIKEGLGKLSLDIQDFKSVFISHQKSERDKEDGERSGNLGSVDLSFPSLKKRSRGAISLDGIGASASVQEKYMSADQHDSLLSLHAKDMSGEVGKSVQICKLEEAGNVSNSTGCELPPLELEGRIDSFIGREKELNFLHQCILRSDTVHGINLKMVCVSGYAGYGKTRLVKEYASRCSQSDYQSVFWINAQGVLQITKSFSQILKSIEVKLTGRREKKGDTECPIKSAYRYLKNCKSLFIFDGAKNYQSIEQFLPSYFLDLKFSMVHILITSRQSWEDQVLTFQLDPFTINDAAAFIGSRLSCWNEFDSICDLAWVFENSPLAIENAASYILNQQKKRHSFSVADYLNECFENVRYVYLEKYFENIISLLDTLLESQIGYVRKLSDKQDQGLALLILTVASFLADCDIDKKIFLGLTGGSEDRLESAFSMIKKVCILRGYDYHFRFINFSKLAKESFRSQLEQEGEVAKNLDICLSLLLTQFPYYSDESSDLSKKEILLPHLEKALAEFENLNFSEKANSQSKYLKLLLIALCDTYYGYENRIMDEVGVIRHLLYVTNPTGSNSYDNSNDAISHAEYSIRLAYILEVFIDDLDDEVGPLIESAIDTLDIYAPGSYQMGAALMTYYLFLREEKGSNRKNISLGAVEDGYQDRLLKVAGEIFDPYVQDVSSYTGNDYPSDLKLIRFLEYVCTIYADLGKYDEAAKFFVRNHSVIQRIVVNRPLDAVELLLSISKHCMLKYSYCKQELWSGEARRVLKFLNLGSLTIPLLAEAEMNLAIAYKGLDDHLDAITFFELSMGKIRRLYGRHTLEEASASVECALSCSVVGDYDKASKLFKCALQIYLKLFPAGNVPEIGRLNELIAENSKRSLNAESSMRVPRWEFRRYFDGRALWTQADRNRSDELIKEKLKEGRLHLESTKLFFSAECIDDQSCEFALKDEYGLHVSLSYLQDSRAQSIGTPRSKTKRGKTARSRSQGILSPFFVEEQILNRINNILEGTAQIQDVHDLLTLEFATSNGYYDYHVQQHDIVNLGKVQGYDFDVGNNQIFEIASRKQILEHKRCDNKGQVIRERGQWIREKLQGLQNRAKHEESILTLIIELDTFHWVTLVIAYRNGSYFGYYANSLGQSIPSDIRQILEDNGVSVYDVSVFQQRDSHNCGFWALENATDIRAVLRRNVDLKEEGEGVIGSIRNLLEAGVQNEARPPRNEDYFRGLRNDVSREFENINSDVGRSRQQNEGAAIARRHQDPGSQVYQLLLEFLNLRYTRSSELHRTEIPVGDSGNPQSVLEDPKASNISNPSKGKDGR